LADSFGVGKLENMNNPWDCIVIGGGAAGLSAALVLGRARRRTLVVDAGAQSNLAAHGIGGLLGFDGAPPSDLYSLGVQQLSVYPSVEFRSGEIVGVDTGFTVELADGTRERATTILLATGMDYRAPEVEGLAELWGSSAFHCPFCHGWEMRDQPLAVLGSGDRAVHSALMLRNWSDDVVVLGVVDDAQRGQLAAAGVTVDDRDVARLVSQDGELAAVEFTDGDRLARRGVLVAVTLHQRSALVEQLGLATVASPISADAVVTDPFQRTSVPGVFAAGDVGAGMPQVAAAIASGSLAATAVVQHLVAGDVGLPVPPWPVEKETINA
jgi:thioredoxin reductase